jgi:ankyrin repeat protein
LLQTDDQVETWRGGEVAKAFGPIAAAALALATLAAPAGAQQYSDGYTFLKAVRDKDPEKVNSTLNSSPTVVNIRDQSAGEGALHYVTRDRELVWLNFLLGKGARPDIQNNRGETPLSLAAQIGWIEGATALLNNRASVVLGNPRGETPLMIAVQHRDLPMVQLLLARGANPNKTDRVSGYSALDFAKRDPRAAAIARILAEKAKPAAPRL